MTKRAPTVRVDRPRRVGSYGGYDLHGVVVTVHGATAEQIQSADALAASFAGTQRDVARPGRYLVRQRPLSREGEWALAGDADRELVVEKAKRLARVLRNVLDRKSRATP